MTKLLHMEVWSFFTSHLLLATGRIGSSLALGAIYFLEESICVLLVVQFSFGFFQIIGGCLFIAGFAFFVLPFINTIPLLAIISFIIGLGLGCCQPLSIVLAYNASPIGHSGEVLGIRLTVNKAVQFTVPIVFGSISFLGFFPIFWFNTALLFFSGGSLLKVFQYKKATPKKSNN